MKLFKLFQSKKSLKDTIEAIERDIKQIISMHLDEHFFVTHYGAYDIDPKYLVFWICVDNDETKRKFEKDENLNSKLSDTLYKNKYPEKAIPNVYIGFESQETVDRESKGDWWIHFK